MYIENEMIIRTSVFLYPDSFEIPISPPSVNTVHIEPDILVI